MVKLIVYAPVNTGSLARFPRLGGSHPPRAVTCLHQDSNASCT